MVKQLLSKFKIPALHHHISFGDELKAGLATKDEMMDSLMLEDAA